MAKRFNKNISLGSELADFAKDIGGILIKGLGRIFGVGIVAGIFGGVGGGIMAAVYGLPIVGFTIGGAVVAAVVVYAILLIAMSEY